MGNERECEDSIDVHERTDSQSVFDRTRTDLQYLRRSVLHSTCAVSVYSNNLRSPMKTNLSYLKKIIVSQWIVEPFWQSCLDGCFVYYQIRPTIHCAQIRYHHLINQLPYCIFVFFKKSFWIIYFISLCRLHMFILRKASPMVCIVTFIVLLT